MNTLKVDTNKLNKYFNETAARLVSWKSMSKKKKITSLIDSFNDKENTFQLQPVTYENTEKCTGRTDAQGMKQGPIYELEGYGEKGKMRS